MGGEEDDFLLFSAFVEHVMKVGFTLSKVYFLTEYIFLIV